MNPYEPVDKRLTALAEWLKSNATDSQEPSNADMIDTKLYHNHAKFFYHPYASFGEQFANNGFAKYISKPQRERTTFTESHLQILENCFHEVKHPDTSRREKLAKQLGLPIKTIQIWFQNRRAKERKDEKEKSVNNACIKDWQRPSEQESDYNLTCNSGSPGCAGTKTSATNLGSNRGSLETGTTTVVEELDSSIKKHERSESTLPIKENRHREGEFTIVHIPEIHSTPDNHQINSIPVSTDSSNLIGQTNIDEISNITPVESTIEQQFASLVENLDINLIVQTYEVLQSSDNPDILIENWFSDCSCDEKNGVEKLTLEENLKHFIQFSKKVK